MKRSCPLPELFASACCSIALSASANARDGDLDTTFNGTGLQILEGPTDELDIQIVGGCIDADDVVLVAAFVYDPLGGEEARDFLVARWREDGTPDTDFSFDGQMQVGFENGYPQGCAMAPDGRIVVFGNAMDATHPETFIDIAIARIDSDGTLDNSFDGDGRTMVDFSLGGTFDGGSDALVRADGRIVAVGEAQTSVGAKAAVTRLTLDGQRDDSFDLDGRVSFGFDAGNPTEFASAAAVAEDGQSRLLIAASTDTRGSGDFAIIRLLENGSLDASFGDGGKAIVPFDLAGNLHDTATSVLVQPDGRIVGAGFACSGGDETSCHTRDIAIMRLDESGDLDPTFGFGGRRAFPLDIGGTLDDVAFQVLHQHDGRLILTGFLDAGASLGYEFFALRLLADGRPDPDFGTGGLVVHGYNAGEATSDFGFRARLDSRERIVITGQLSMSDGRSRGMLMRLANGDSLFGDGFDPI